jgi:hypothetical protein
LRELKERKEDAAEKSVNRMQAFVNKKDFLFIVVSYIYIGEANLIYRDPNG